MAARWRVLIGVVALAWWAVPSAQAFGDCGWFWPPTVAYHYPWPVYYYYPRVIAVPDALAGQKTPPSAKPVIIATRGFAANAGTPKRDRLKIGFWNLTGRDITLTVDGKTRTLAKNRSLTLQLEREFSWQVDREQAHLERVPDAQSVYEVVIRD